MQKPTLVAVVVVVGLLATTGPAQSDGSGELRQGVSAKPLERRKPTYPPGERDTFRGGEGWTLASFVIRDDGSVGDILIDDSFGGRAFEKSTRKAMRNWRYEPAQLGGEKVQQCHHQVLLTYQLKGTPPGAGSGFIRRYKRAAKALQADDLDEAEEKIAQVKAVNLYEASQLALLRAHLAQRQGNSGEQHKQLWRARIQAGDFLSEEEHAGVLTRLVLLQLQSNMIKRARTTYAELEALEPKGGIPKALQEALQRTEEMMSKDTDIAVKGRLPLRSEDETGHTRWTRGVVRRIVGIEDVEGSVDHVDLRCEFHRAIWTPKPGKAWRISPEWGSCWLHVFGEPETTFNLIEYSDSLANEQAKADVSK